MSNLLEENEDDDDDDDDDDDEIWEVWEGGRSCSCTVLPVTDGVGLRTISGESSTRLALCKQVSIQVYSFNCFNASCEHLYSYTWYITITDGTSINHECGYRQQTNQFVPVSPIDLKRFVKICPYLRLNLFRNIDSKHRSIPLHHGDDKTRSCYQSNAHYYIACLHTGGG